jgi:YVTN family beta-propeller protein
MRLSGFLPRAVLALLLLTPTYVAAQVTSYVFVPNGNSSTVSVIDTRAGAIDGLPIPVGSNPGAAVPTPDGRRVYVTNFTDDSVTVIDVATRLPVGAPIPVGSLPRGIASARTEGWIYVANSGSNSVSVIDVDTDTVTATIPVGVEPVAVAVAGSRALVANYLSNTVSIIDISDNTVVGTIPVGTGPFFVSFHPDGVHAYVSNLTANTVSMIDVPAQAVIETIPVGTAPAGSVVTPDGATLLVANRASDSVSVIDTATNSGIASVFVGIGPVCVAIAPDGKTAYVANSDSNNVSVIDVPSRSITSTIAVGQHPFPMSKFAGPNIITTKCAGCGPLSIASDADLTALGFKDYVSFDAGTLVLTGTWDNDSRFVSLLAGGATIDTNGFDANLFVDVLGEGTLIKEGAGRLTMPRGLHTGGTELRHGSVSVYQHLVPMHVRGGTLSGVLGATLGTIDATAGTITPGTDGPVLMSAAQVTLTSGVTFIAKINGASEEDGEYDQLAVSGTATLGGATLNVQLGYTPAPGDAFRILTHASGTFAGLPEGAVFTVNGRSFRITYHGGDGSDVVLIVDSAPTLSAIGNQTIFAGHAFEPIAFTIGDDATPPSALVVTATSSNTALLPNTNLVLGGSGASRTLTAMAVADASGTTTVTVTVSDGWQTTQRTFTLTVLSVPVYYLAEGSTGGFFSTDLLIANPNDTDAPATLTFYTEHNGVVTKNITVPAMQRLTMTLNTLSEIGDGAVSTIVTSTGGVPLVVERTMRWDKSGYGASGDKAVEGPATNWYFAEGSQGYFFTYVLLANPQTTSNTATVTYFREGDTPITRTYDLAPQSRTTLDLGADAALINRSFGFQVQFAQPGVAERAMYFGKNPFWTGGHESAGVTSPATDWLLAEGATGPFFETFILLANPNATDAEATVTFLPAGGSPVVKTKTIPANGRLTINIEQEDPALANAAVATHVHATLPVVAERSQYWPDPAPQWYEAHNSFGITSPDTKWGLAEGRVGQAATYQTFILLANPGESDADVSVQFLHENGGAPITRTFTVHAMSRLNVWVGGADSDVPELVDENFFTVITSDRPIAVERSMYANANGQTWAAGTNATATRLP